MKWKIGMLLLLLSLLPHQVFAHIVNDQNLYEDLQYSTAKEEIVWLSGLGVIVSDHGTPLFSPKEKLTRSELAYWAGTFYRLLESAAGREEIAAAAVEKGLLSSLNGNATYEDVNNVYFQGQIDIDNPGDELSKEEFALFVYEHRLEQIEGKTLYDQAGYGAGPTGTVEEVFVRFKTTYLKLNGKEYPLAAHPRILNASVDPATWKGKSVEESWLMAAADGQEQLQLIRFVPSTQTAAASPSSPAETAAAGHVHPVSAHGESVEQEEAKSGFFVASITIAALFAVFISTLWVAKKRM